MLHNAKREMLQGLPIVLAQIKPGNLSENLLNEIYNKWFHSLYCSKKVSKKLYNNKMN